MRVPKSLGLLEDQLHRLAPALHPDTVVLGTGMVTDIHTSTLKLFERILGPTRTSLAVRKARLILCTPDRALDPGPNPWPLRYALPGDIGVVSGRTVTNHAGTFCADRLDIGTRFLLAHLPTAAPGARVVDLGCGNGVVGTAAALATPGIELLFVDESHPAVASAEETFRANLGPDARAEFRTADALDDADVAVARWTSSSTTRRSTRTRPPPTPPPGGCSPAPAAPCAPAASSGWSATAISTTTSSSMRLFGNCRTVAGNPKFVVLKAVKR